MTRCVGYPTLKGHENPNDGDYIVLDPNTSTVPPHDKVSAQRHRPLMAHRTGNDIYLTNLSSAVLYVSTSNIAL